MAGYIEPELINEISDRIDIVQLIESYIPLKKRGRNYIALCPFHLEDTPSFSVSADKQIFYCFGCQKGGGPIRFVMEYEHLSFLEATEKLAQQVGVQLPEKKMSPTQKRFFDEKQKLYAINNEAARYFHNLLKQSKEGEEARAYLQKRGVSPEVQESYNLGFASHQWDDLKEYLKKQGFREEEMLKAGVLTKSESGSVYDRFRNRLMFPITDAKGHTIAFGGRVLDDSLPKYINSAENVLFHKGRNLYGLSMAIPAIRQHEEAIIMEGYMDVITARQYGIENAIAPLGTAFTTEQAQLLKRYTNKLILSYDGDGAGQKAAMRSMDILSSVDMRADVIIYPDGADPDEFLRKYGKESWDTLKVKAPAAMEYRIEKAFEIFDTNKAEGKADLIENLRPAILGIKNNIAKTEYIRQIAAKLDVNGDMLLREFRQNNPSPNVQQAITTPIKSDGLSQAGATLCRFAVTNKQAFDEIEKTLSWDFVTSPTEKTIIDLIRTNKDSYTWQYNHLIELADEKTKPLIMEYAVRDSGNDAPINEEFFQDCMQKIVHEQLKKEAKDIEKQLKNPSIQQNSEEVSLLLMKFNKIQQELRKKQ